MGLFRSKLFQSVLILVGTFLLFRFGIRPPAPWSVITLYMGVVLLALLVYVSSDGDSWRAFVAPLRALLVDDALRPLRVGLMIVLPLGLGYYAYSQAAATVEAPPELRAVHPAPPASVSFRGKTLDVQGLENPLRKDAANFTTHVAEGAVIYIKNCMVCHGDNLDGAGHFAHAFNPPPANFTDPGTIAMLQEAYLFWRIAKGGPGLPKESSPWNSVMPAWEDRLGEEEIWKVVLYLYDATGYQPRRWEEAAEHKHASVAPSARGVAGLGLLAPRAAEAQQAGDPARGKAVYEKKCMLCHGEQGDGAGPGAAQFEPRPRDFTKGKFKIRTSVSGQVPTDTDLFRIITDGMPGTSMPGWKALSEKDRWSLVAYLKTFAPEAFKAAPKPAVLPKEVASSKESLARGKEMYRPSSATSATAPAGAETARRLPTSRTTGGSGYGPPT